MIQIFGEEDECSDSVNEFQMDKLLFNPKPFSSSSQLFLFLELCCVSPRIRLASFIFGF